MGLVEGDRLLQRLLGHAFVEVPLGADGDEHPLAVRREGEVPRPVSAGGRGQLGDDDLGSAAGLQVAVAIGIADHPVGLGDIDPLWGGPQRIEGDAERLIQAGGEDRALARPGGPGRGPQDADSTLHGDEHIAVGRGAQHPRLLQAGVEHRHLQAGGHLGQGALGRRHDLGHAHADGGEGALQVGGGDVVADARRVLLPAAEHHHAAADHGVVDLGARGIGRRHELRLRRGGRQRGRSANEDAKPKLSGRHGSVSWQGCTTRAGPARGPGD